MAFPTKPLSVFARLASGGTPSKANPSFWGGSVPWLTPKDMSRFDGTTQDSVTRDAIGNGTREASAASLFIAVRGMSLHNEIRVVRPKRQMAFNQDIKAITPDPAVDGRFLHYALLAKIPDLLDAVEAAGHGTGVLPTDKLNSLPIPDLPLPEQRAIAATLGALDDKIELNRKMNATLEAMARALFRDWFVDFGPTRARMAGAAPTLSPDLWPLFPARLDAEGKPEGWEVFKLAQIAEHHTKTLTPAKMADIEVEHFSLPAFDKGQIPAIDHGATIKSNKTIVPPDAILLSKLNPEIPRVWMPETQRGLPQVGSTEFLAFTAKGGAGRCLLFCLFADQGFREMLNGMVTGTSKSHQRISPPALLGREVITGTPTMFEIFEQSVAPLLERVLANRAESRTLAQTRDLLLPRLMSGELRLAEAERLASEVA